MPANKDHPSINDLVPREPGGEEARRGLNFQDHVAAGYYIEMASSDSLAVVWCEAEDDITLVWKGADGTTEAEFVQVKSNEMNQLWSASLVCSEKLIQSALARDYFKEQCKFRVVTARPVMNELEHLELDFDHERRRPDSRAYQTLAEKLVPAVGTLASPKGNDWTYWVSRVKWDVRHSTEYVHLSNLSRFEAATRGWGTPLAHDQREFIYHRLVSRAFEAGLARRLKEPRKKRLTRAEVVEFLTRAIQDARGELSDSNTSLVERLRCVGFTPELITYAQETRLKYLSALRRGRYPWRKDRADIEESVGAMLHSLWAELEAGSISDNPREFYLRCIRGLDRIRPSLHPDHPPTQSALHGMMFDRVARGLHRFDRVKFE